MRIRQFQKALSTSKTGASFASLACSLINAPPSGDGVFEFGLKNGIGGPTPTHAFMMFYGAGLDNTQFDARVIGYKSVGSAETAMWIPFILAHFTVTRSAFTGVANGLLVTTDRFADTIIVHATYPQPRFTDTDSAGAATRGTIIIESPANDLPGWASVPLRGCKYVKFDFATTGGTDSNALVCFESCD